MIHGRTRRVRRKRRQTGQSADDGISINKEELVNTVITAAISGLISSYATKKILEDR